MKEIWRVYVITMSMYLISMILHPTRYEGGMAGICSCSPDQISLPYGSMPLCCNLATSWVSVLVLLVAW